MTHARANPRFPYTEYIQVREPCGVRGYSARDLSLGGVRVHGELNLLRGADVKIYLPLRRVERAGSRFCLLDGKVAWSRTREAGIQFCDVDVLTALQIASFLATLHGDETVAELAAGTQLLRAL